jgi:hypothetical protein
MIGFLDIAVFAGALKLHNEFLHQPPACPGIFPGDAVCKCSPFVSAGFWFLIPYCAQDHTLERFRRRIQEFRRGREREFLNCLRANGVFDSNPYRRPICM